MATSLAAVCVFAAFLPYGCWSHGLGKNISSLKDRPDLQTPDVLTPVQPSPLDYFGMSSMDGTLPLSEGLQTGPKNPVQAAQRNSPCFECLKGTCEKNTQTCQTKRNTCPFVYGELAKAGEIIQTYEDVCTGVKCGQIFRFNFQLGVSRAKSTCKPVPCHILSKVFPPLKTDDNKLLCPWCYAKNEESCTSKEEKRCKGEENTCISVTSRDSTGKIEFSMKGCGTDNLCNVGCCLFPPRTVQIKCGSGPSNIHTEHGIFMAVVAGVLPLVALWQASDQSPFLKL